MKLIIGLGNPEEKYSKTRHNVGFLFADKLLEKQLVKDVLVLKSKDFMNNSGSFVQSQAAFYKINPQDLYIVHDDLDIALGEYKIQLGTGPKVHNGVNDIEEKLGTKDFWRIRIGVDNREVDNRIPGEAYVLQNFKTEELELLNKTIDNVIEELLTKIT